MRPARILLEVIAVSLLVWVGTTWLHQQGLHSLDSLTIVLGGLAFVSLVAYRTARWWVPFLSDTA